MSKFTDLIVQIANAYANAKITEIQVNQGFTNIPFENDMKSVGWTPGAEWCAANGKLIWKKGYISNTAVWAIANKLFSLNSQQTANNFHNDPLWPTSVSIPKLGAIVVWAMGDSHTEGHLGIIVWISDDGKSFISVEGNTSAPGDPDTRLGWTIAAHKHIVGAPHSLYNLNLLRFVYAIDSYSPLIYS